MSTPATNISREGALGADKHLVTSILLNKKIRSWLFHVRFIIMEYRMGMLHENWKQLSMCMDIESSPPKLLSACYKVCYFTGHCMYTFTLNLVTYHLSVLCKLEKTPYKGAATSS